MDDKLKHITINRLVLKYLERCVSECGRDISNFQLEIKKLIDLPDLKNQYSVNDWIINQNNITTKINEGSEQWAMLKVAEGKLRNIIISFKLSHDL